MINIKERNSPNLFVYILISLFGIFIVWNEYQRNKSGIELIFLSGGFFLFLFVLFLRNLDIILEKNSLKIKFNLIGITYKSILVEFDKVQVNDMLNYDIIFTKDGRDVLSFILNTDSEDDKQNMFLLLEMHHKGKSYQIGNKKNAKVLFERIKDACKKEI